MVIGNWPVQCRQVPWSDTKVVLSRIVGNIACSTSFYRQSHHEGGLCGREINTSNSRSGGLAFKLCPSCCFLRQQTILHFVALHPGV